VSAYARQVSGIGPEGGFVLSVLAKASYRIEPSGRCLLEDAPPAWQAAPLFCGTYARLVEDSDAYAYKPRTDVIVRGHAHPPTRCASFEIEICIGGNRRTVVVTGERRVYRTASGAVTFSEPALVEDAVPLSPEGAYGGTDRGALIRHGSPLAGLAPYLPEHPSLAWLNPYFYAHNPCGVGFALEDAPGAIDDIALPSLEEPHDRLTPDRLFAGRLENWPALPRPALFDWVSHVWFPRAECLGIGAGQRAAGRDSASTLGPLSHDVAAGTNGAPALQQLAYLRGGEEVVLTNLHPLRPLIRFRLPAPPRLWADGRKGRLHATEPVAHTLLLEPGRERLTVLWRGLAPALRPYSPAELETMPFRMEW
jgi:hypothetical protein